MFKFVEKKIQGKLKDLENTKSEKEKELNAYNDKLEDIKEYESLSRYVFNGSIFSFFATLFSGAIGFGCILLLVKVFCLKAVIFCAFASIPVALCGAFAYMTIKKIVQSIKDINYLKKKDIKKMKKQYGELLEQKKRLENEIAKINEEENSYNIDLRFIDFFDKVKNDPFFLADTEEEYEEFLDAKQKYEELLDEFLNAGVDYSSVHLNDCDIPAVTLKKSIK